MDGKIGLEEHFALAETLGDSAGFVGEETWRDLRVRLLDIQSERLRLMDAHGIETMILSLNSPAVQAVTDPAAASDLARRANDILAEQIARNPRRAVGTSFSTACSSPATGRCRRWRSWRATRPAQRSMPIRSARGCCSCSPFFILPARVRERDARRRRRVHQPDPHEDRCQQRQGSGRQAGRANARRLGRGAHGVGRNLAGRPDRIGHGQ